MTLTHDYWTERIEAVEADLARAKVSKNTFAFRDVEALTNYLRWLQCKKIGVNP